MPVDNLPAPVSPGEVANGQPQKFRTSSTRKDGSLIEVELAYLPLIIDGQITGVHSIARDVTQSSDYELRIEHLANHDVLTGLPNRLLLTDRLLKPTWRCTKPKNWDRLRSDFTIPR